MIKSLFPVALCAVLIPSFLPGQELFVDGIRGEDSNPGSPRQPLKSITAALALALSETTIFVLPGRYSAARTGEVFPLAFGRSRDHSGVALFGVDTVVLDLDGVDGTAISVGAHANGGRITNLRFEGMDGTPASNRVVSVEASAPSPNDFAFELDRCVFEGCSRGIVFPDGVASRGWRIHNNLFVDVASVGVEDPAPGSAHDIYNNTFVRGSGVGIVTQSDGTRILNNLLTELETGISSDGGAAAVAQRLRANDFWDNRRAVAGQAFSAGFPADNYRLDPEFRDAAAGDFRLAFRSALIDLGEPDVFTRADLDANPGAVDFDGDGRLQPDVGAYEATPVELTVDYQREVLSFHLSGSSTLYWLRLGFVLVAVDDGLVRLPGLSPILLDPGPLTAFPAFVGTMPVGFRTFLPTPPAGSRLVLQGFGYEPSLGLLIGGPQRRLQF